MKTFGSTLKGKTVASVLISKYVIVVDLFTTTTPDIVWANTVKNEPVSYSVLQQQFLPASTIRLAPSSLYCLSLLLILYCLEAHGKIHRGVKQLLPASALTVCNITVTISCNHIHKVHFVRTAAEENDKNQYGHKLKP